jgi:hypothetical protein
MRRPPPLPVEHSAHSDNENTDSDDGSADTEFEWLDESLAGLTPKFTSKVSEAIVIEVCSFFFGDFRC